MITEGIDFVVCTDCGREQDPDVARLGCFGTTEWFRCRGCGINFTPAQVADEEAA